MGGTDAAENLALLTPEEHAEAHFLLYLEHGKQEDWDAYHGLAGLIGKDELFLNSSRRGGSHPKSHETREKISKSNQGKPRHTKESKARISAARKGKPLSKQHRKKLSDALTGNTNSLGSPRRKSKNQ
jgi:hypothetical protein